MAYKRLILISTVFVLLVVSCDQYVADPLDPRMPAYTQNGYDDSGCYIGGAIWRDKCDFDDGCFIWSFAYDSVDNKTRLRLNGEIRISNKDVSLRFDFADTKISTFEDIQSIEDRTFIFGDNSPHKATLSSALHADCGDIIDQYGEFTIRSTGQTEGNEETQNYFSGTFGYDLQTACDEYQVYKGRFDFSVSSGRFTHEDL